MPVDPVAEVVKPLFRKIYPLPRARKSPLQWALVVLPRQTAETLYSESALLR
uniref:Uncharacterized protein n=1 Tax=Siphoviridae sp. ctCUc43 TaxID=2825379 RepID=A0A8S5QIM6_9CAUD|nr:MAG TPA: hypothetical protein [Siphoviridae sp. ctCUc43]